MAEIIHKIDLAALNSEERSRVIQCLSRYPAEIYKDAAYFRMEAATAVAVIRQIAEETNLPVCHIIRHRRSAGVRE